MDVLSDVLRSIRLSGAVLFRAEFSAPWACAAPASAQVAPLLKPDAARLVLFHVVAEGRGWAQTESGDRADFGAGDILVLCGGDAHVLGSGAPERTAHIAELLPPPPWTEPPRLCYGGGGARTTIVCGFLHCDEMLFHPLLRTLPRLLRVRTGTSAEWVEANLSYPLEEVRAGRLGSESLLSRSAELLFLDVLRRHIAEWQPETLGWVGARLLREDRESIAAIAEQIGYESERAFHRAFKRHAGVTPVAWRNTGGQVEPRARDLSSTRTALRSGNPASLSWKSAPRSC